MRRLIRAAAALAVLLVALVGVPLLLLALRGAPWVSPVPGRSLLDVLRRPDDGSVLLALITWAAWLAWVVVAVSVLAELVTLVSRQRIRVRLPGLGGPQRAAGGLLLAVLALSVAPAVPHVGPAPSAAHAAAPQPPVAPAGAATRDPTPDAAAPRRADPVPATAHQHLVRPGDDLWSLAERYYGDGRQWRRIAAANPAVLTGGPDRLVVGWRLVVPEPLVAPDGAGADADREVRVRAGDTLTSLADRELGRAARWPELYQANRDRLDDPDELDAGMSLVLPGRPAAAERPPRSAPPDPAPRTSAVPAAEPGPRRPGPRQDGPATPVAPGDAAPPGPVSAGASQAEEDGPEVLLPLAGIGGLLAAGLLGGLAARRRLQLQARPVGRRIVHPPPSALPAQAALARRERPLTLRTLDHALRAVGAACRAGQLALPPLQLALVADDRIELLLARPCPTAPLGFEVRGRSWVLDRSGAAYLRSVPGADEALRPWPALVTLGRDRQDRQVLADLEALGLLRLEGGAPGASDAVLAAMAVELSFSPWAEEMTLTLLGASVGLPAALGRHGVQHEPDADPVLERLEHRAVEQRRHQPHEVLGQHRLDPDLAEPWAPEVVLIGRPLGPAQQERLATLVTAQPRVTTAAVVVSDGVGDGAWSLHLPDQDDGCAVLRPLELELVPQRLEPEEADTVLDLVRATGSAETTPAPWWQAEAEDPDPPPDNVAYLGMRFGGWATESGKGEEVVQTAAVDDGALAHVEHPTLLLLGPVELRGAAGVLPPRAGKQCLEYCAWLLENPGRTAYGMAGALAVAEGTRRSNMSRLRSWLGQSPDGEAYLPDAYTGRIVLHPAVSSDWQRLQILTAGGVNRASTPALRAALQLVRGAPLADTAPGQWHWAEELRTDMISCVRDVGVELTRRALEEQDLDLARWAAARALAAAPGDELLVAARIRTEHLAGNPAETERLTLQLAAQARRLGVDLEPQTVALLQEVVEGRVRARLA